MSNKCQTIVVFVQRTRFLMIEACVCVFVVAIAAV